LRHNLCAKILNFFFTNEKIGNSKDIKIVDFYVFFINILDSIVDRISILNKNLIYNGPVNWKLQKILIIKINAAVAWMILTEKFKLLTDNYLTNAEILNKLLIKIWILFGIRKSKKDNFKISR
jgi:hypothetical protein